MVRLRPINDSLLKARPIGEFGSGALSRTRKGGFRKVQTQSRQSENPPDPTIPEARSFSGELAIVFLGKMAVA
jgi:hypothetical protein